MPLYFCRARALPAFSRMPPARTYTFLDISIAYFSLLYRAATSPLMMGDISRRSGALLRAATRATVSIYFHFTAFSRVPFLHWLIIYFIENFGFHYIFHMMMLCFHYQKDTAVEITEATISKYMISGLAFRRRHSLRTAASGSFSSRHFTPMQLVPLSLFIYARHDFRGKDAFAFLAQARYCLIIPMGARARGGDI